MAASDSLPDICELLKYECASIFQFAQLIISKEFITSDLEPSCKQIFLKRKPGNRYYLLYLPSSETSHPSWPHHFLNSSTTMTFSHSSEYSLEYVITHNCPTLKSCFPRLLFFSITSSLLDSFYIPFNTPTLWPH